MTHNTGYVVREHDGLWWATWGVTPLVPVWVDGGTPAAALEALEALIPYPWQPGSSNAVVETWQDADGVWYAQCPDYGEPVSTGESSGQASSTLVAHVPLPQSTGGSTAGRPPKLEDRPLPPV